FIAIIAGWFVTEQGRQPWVAQGLMRTADGLSPVSGTSLTLSLALFFVIYAIIFSLGLYYMNRLILRGPFGEAPEGPAAVPSRPLSASTQAARTASGGYRGEALAHPPEERQGEDTMEWYLPVIWAGVLAIAVAMNVVLDGCD